MCGSPVRGEQWKLAYATESTYGTDPGTAYYINPFGVVQTATMPDPEIEFQPIWTLGTASKRDWYIAYKGRMALSGSIPDIWLLDGRPLRFPVGSVATTGTTKAGGSTTLNGIHAIGVTSLTVVASTDFIAGDVCQIDTGTSAECATISAVPDGTHLTLSSRTVFAHATAMAVVEKQSPYTHTISEATTLDSIALHLTIQDADGNIELMRRFLGGKVNRATYTAMEGDFLKMSYDEILFKNYLNNQTGEPGYNAGVADAAAISYPTTQPYLFSYGALSLGEVGSPEFARIRGFRLSVTNNFEPKYYVTDDAIAQLPYEHREGRREYALGCTIDIEDSTLYKELVRQGTYSTVYKGFQVVIVFTRAASDTITFTLPSSATATGGDAMGCLIRSAPHHIVDSPLVSVDLDIISRGLGIVVVDSVVAYP